MFGFSELCSSISNLLIRGIRNLASKIRQYKIERARRRRDNRTAFAQAMVEPLRRELAHQSIGRGLFMVEELPQGSYARYDQISRVINDRVGIPRVINDRVGIPSNLMVGDFSLDASTARDESILSETMCAVCGGMGDDCSHLSYIEDMQRVFEEADRANDAVQLSFDEELDRDTNSAYREYNS